MNNTSLKNHVFMPSNIRTRINYMIKNIFIPLTLFYYILIISSRLFLCFLCAYCFFS